jgi:hypothetical protein
MVCALLCHAVMKTLVLEAALAWNGCRWPSGAPPAADVAGPLASAGKITYTLEFDGPEWSIPDFDKEPGGCIDYAGRAHNSSLLVIYH